MTDQPHDLLFDAVPHKLFFAITFRDIGEDWQLGIYCMLCRRSAPISMSRERFEELSWTGQLRHMTRRFRCSACGNTTGNRVTVVGRRRCWRVFPSGGILRNAFPLSAEPHTVIATRISLGGRMSMIWGRSPRQTKNAPRPKGDGAC